MSVCVCGRGGDVEGHRWQLLNRIPPNGTLTVIGSNGLYSQPSQDYREESGRHLRGGLGWWVWSQNKG